MQLGSFIYSRLLAVWFFFLSLPWLQFLPFIFPALLSTPSTPTFAPHTPSPLPTSVQEPGPGPDRWLLWGRWIAPGDKQESGLGRATFWVRERNSNCYDSEPSALAEDHPGGSASKRSPGEAEQGRKVLESHGPSHIWACSSKAPGKLARKSEEPKAARGMFDSVSTFHMWSGLRTWILRFLQK